jgi:DNA-binding NarL/FixJ family response regulator
MKLMIVEDNPSLLSALSQGFKSLGGVEIVATASMGEDALGVCLETNPEVVLMDVQLAGAWNGIQTAVSLRRELPRLPVVFYSIQDEEVYYRDFLNSGILSHYAYVRKSNYLLPGQLIPLFKSVMAGSSFIDPEIEQRVQDVRHMDEASPLACLEPHERTVAGLIAQGYTNEQIAEQMGYKDKRTISRTNGQIYAAWGLDATTTDEKVARTRAALIYTSGRMLEWSLTGQPGYRNERGEWVPWSGHER